MNYKYLIVGGGIAGLYSALELITKHAVKPSEIYITEKSYRWGRRVHTLERDGIIYECGAGRFNMRHKRLLGLIKRYGLKDKIVPLSKNSKNTLVMKKGILEVSSVSDYIERLINSSLSKQELQSKTLRQLSTEMFGVETTVLIEQEFGYHDDFSLGNAWDTIAEIRSNWGADYYVLSGGLEQIVSALVRELKEAGVKMVLKQKFMGWERSEKGFTSTVSDIDGNLTKINSKKIILALDKCGLAQIPNLECLDVFINSVSTSALTRIYAQFPIDNEASLAWFHGIPKTYTNLPIQTFIPIDERTGFCMISYSDGENARMWQELFIQGPEFLEKELMRQIRQQFPDHQIPQPKWIQKLHWAKGVHLWRPYVDSDTVYSKIQNPFPDVFICGEAFSRLQGWIEGAIHTSAEVCKLSVGSNVKNVISMEEVARSKSLTVINGQVYDLSKEDWLARHPGGDIIKKAIGRDATEMYRYINHPAYANQLLESLWVGSLKKID